MSTELFDLSGQVAVVIGGARDLGRDMAASLADAGCHLAITSRQEASAQATAQQLQETYGRKVYSAALDICDHAALSQFAEDVRQWQGRVDVVVNNAGGGLGLSTTDFFARPPEDARLLIDTNLTGPPLLLPNFRPHHGRTRFGIHYQYRLHRRSSGPRPPHVSAQRLAPATG